jgi:hypothetical protein
MIIQVPVTTEAINQNDDLQPSSKTEDQKLIIEFDTRKRNYHQLFGLKRKVKIG